MANDYVTVAEVKNAMIDNGIDAGESDYTAILTKIITETSRMFDRETKRKPGAYYVSSTDEETRYYTGSGESVQWVDELTTAPSYLGISEGGRVQSTDYTTISSSDYFMYPDNAALDGKPYQRIDLDDINGAYSTFYRYRKSVKVTGPFGYSATVPDDIKKAIIARAIILFGRSQMGFVASTGSQELGFKRYAKIDEDWQAVVDHYKRVTV